MNDPDILTRLRESDGGYFMRKMFTEAADEIERLRKERDEASQRVCSIAYPEQHIQELVKTINTLRAERDEARREVCNMKDFHGLPRDYALERGWDCFKENA